LSSLREHAQDRLFDLGAAREVLDGALSLLSEVKNSYTAHKNFCNDDGNLLLAQIEKLSEQLNINQTKGELHGNPERLSGIRINN
jgi:hypothetical protein